VRSAYGIRYQSPHRGLDLGLRRVCTTRQSLECQPGALTAAYPAASSASACAAAAYSSRVGRSTARCMSAALGRVYSLVPSAARRGRACGNRGATAAGVDLPAWMGPARRLALPDAEPGRSSKAATEDLGAQMLVVHACGANCAGGWAGSRTGRAARAGRHHAGGGHGWRGDGG
jgi:hypothetical protein